MEKFWQFARQISEFMTWQRVACPFEATPEVTEYIQSKSLYDENSKLKI